MTENQPTPPNHNVRGPDLSTFEIDRSVAGEARVHNYLIGGHDNFSVDRELAEHLRTLSPSETDIARAVVRAMAAFTLRVVRYLVAEAGVRQLLCAVPPVPSVDDNLHQVAQKIAPDARVVYFNRDAVVMAHAHVLRTSTPEGASDYIHGDIDDVTRILETAAATLDFTRPVGLVLPGLSRFTEEHDPYGIVARLLDAGPSGSYLALGHMTSDIATEWATTAAKFMRDALRKPWTLRSHAEVSRFFEGLELVEGGVVQIDQWRRHENRPIPDAENMIPLYGGVGRKP